MQYIIMARLFKTNENKVTNAIAAQIYILGVSNSSGTKKVKKWAYCK